ncbi:MAG: SDR family NAD(P)-dependent oxidoreductase [Chitinophagaceae bacterium]
MSNNFYTLITGASEGFGKALAIECARRRMNLILVALPGVELHRVADFIKSKYPVDVVCIEKDLCIDGSCLEVFHVADARGLQVNVLLNNVGIGTTGLFADTTIEEYEKQIKLNVLATTVITRLFLDMLKRNSPSHILNIGSLASFFPLPKKQVYGATKSYIYYFSECLRAELKKDKVNVSLLCPGVMKTNKAVTSIIQNSHYLLRRSCIEPGKLAPFVIDEMFKRKKRIISGKLNKGYVMLYSILPGFIKSIITNCTMKKLTSHTLTADFSNKSFRFEADKACQHL